MPLSFETDFSRFLDRFSALLGNPGILPDEEIVRLFHSIEILKNEIFENPEVAPLRAQRKRIKDFHHSYMDEILVDARGKFSEPLKQKARDLYELYDTVRASNIGLIANHAIEFGERDLQMRDYFLAAWNFGIRRAIDKFNPQITRKFSTYAAPWIRNSMYDLRHVFLPVIALPNFVADHREREPVDICAVADEFRNISDRWEVFLAGLTSEEKQIWLLRHGLNEQGPELVDDQKPLKDVSAAMGISEGIVQHKAAEARRKLRDRFQVLNFVGIFYTPEFTNWYRSSFDPAFSRRDECAKIGLLYLQSENTLYQIGVSLKIPNTARILLKSLQMVGHVLPNDVFGVQAHEFSAAQLGAAFTEHRNLIRRNVLKAYKGFTNDSVPQYAQDIPRLER